jgi:hypothetical protein
MPTAIRVLLALVVASATSCSDYCPPGSTSPACLTKSEDTAAEPGATAGGGTGAAGAEGVAGFEAYGTKPNGAHVSLDCTPSQVPAFAAHDCLYSHLRLPESVKCTMKLADRFGVVVGVATPASFMAEAGVVTPVAASPAFPAAADVLGHAEGYLEILGGPLPADVPPMAGELSVSHDFGCGPRTANPRDGYVTVIAWVNGEEGFADLNRNGAYDVGEPFVDEGEPFVDANDNGIRDAGEWWLDVNGDGVYTGGNGKWDADGVIWSQTRVVYTGLPAFLVDGSSRNLLTRIHDLAGPTPPAPTAPPTPFLVHAGPPPTSTLFGVFFTDALLNPLDPEAEYLATSAAGNVTASLTVPSLPLRPPPATFRLLYCDRPQLPASCHDGPVESGCRTAPCYVVPEVGFCLTASCGGFAYGQYADLSVGGSRPGADIVWVSATVADVTTSFSIAGQCVP